MSATSQIDLHPDADRLNAFAEDCLSEKERQTVLAHIACCSRCRGIIFLVHQADEDSPGRAAPVAPSLYPSEVRGWLDGRHLAWMAGCSIAAALSIVLFLNTRHVSPAQQVARATAPMGVRKLNPNESLQAEILPAQPLFDTRDEAIWALPSSTALAQEMPDYRSRTATLGAPDLGQYARWSLATVIIRSSKGWGSGAFISGDGWILSNYEVVEAAAQQAAVSGSPARFEITTANIIDGQLAPGPPLKATLYRADPVRDLALLKLDVLPSNQTQVSFFPIAVQTPEREDGYVIGSHQSGSAWQIRGCSVFKYLDFPGKTKEFSADGFSGDVAPSRRIIRLAVTDVRSTAGDLGGPLINGKGELIGIQFSAGAKSNASPVSWFIALSELRTFTATMPRKLEGVPFDTWDVGLPQASILKPELVDSEHSGRTESLLYRHADVVNGKPVQPLALTVFVDFAQHATELSHGLDLVPYGLWGWGNRGRFRFNLFVTLRSDHLTAVGYTNKDGILNEVRLGRASLSATVVWRRDSDGVWSSSRPRAFLPLIEQTRFSNSDLQGLEAVLRKVLPAATYLDTGLLHWCKENRCD